MEIAVNTVLRMTEEEFQRLETLCEMVNEEYGTEDSIEEIVKNVADQFLFEHIESNLELLLDDSN